jgi:hypothetical protein
MEYYNWGLLLCNVFTSFSLYQFLGKFNINKIKIQLELTVMQFNLLRCKM